MSNTGSSIGNDIKGVVKGIHGAGEAIRGTFNQSVDAAFNDKEGEAKNRIVTGKGINEVESADRTVGGARHVVTTGGATGATTTGAGAHSGTVGNLESNPAATGNMAYEPGSRNHRF
jgi:hypothetical protein